LLSTAVSSTFLWLEVTWLRLLVICSEKGIKSSQSRRVSKLQKWSKKSILMLCRMGICSKSSRTLITGWIIKNSKSSMTSTLKVLYLAKMSLTKYQSALKDSWPLKCFSTLKSLIKSTVSQSTPLLTKWFSSVPSIPEENCTGTSLSVADQHFSRDSSNDCKTGCANESTND
jgi:hypothetical protein